MTTMYDYSVSARSTWAFSNHNWQSKSEWQVSTSKEWYQSTGIKGRQEGAGRTLWGFSHSRFRKNGYDGS